MTNKVMESLHKHLHRFMTVDLVLGIIIISPLLVTLPIYFVYRWYLGTHPPIRIDIALGSVQAVLLFLQMLQSPN